MYTQALLTEEGEIKEVSAKEREELLDSENLFDYGLKPIHLVTLLRYSKFELKGLEFFRYKISSLERFDPLKMKDRRLELFELFVDPSELIYIKDAITKY